MSLDQGAARAQLWRVDSAGVPVLVGTSGNDEAWWRRMLPHLPGVHAVPARAPFVANADESVVRLAPRLGPGDGRRLVNAHLHVRHLAVGTLSVHAVALVRSGRAVLLVGGHGAGKTLVGLALAEQGWEAVAGDVALVKVQEQGEACPAVLDGTQAYLADAHAVSRYFPTLVAGLTGKRDLGDRLAWAATVPGGFPIDAVALVDVDADPVRRRVTRILDPHTATTLWYRASGHLLDRVLVRGGGPLRLLETRPAAERRLDLVRRIGSALPVYAMRGTPTSIAAAIADLPQFAAGYGEHPGAPTMGAWAR